MAWLAKRWPLVAGILLIAVSIFFFSFFGLQEVFSGDPRGLRRIPVVVLFVGPLVSSGVALIASRSVEISSE